MSKQFLNSYANTQLMCVYCEGLIPDNAVYCEPCHEYKGIMTIADFHKYFGEEY